MLLFHFHVSYCFEMLVVETLEFCIYMTVNYLKYFLQIDPEAKALIKCISSCLFENSFQSFLFKIVWKLKV